MSLGEKQQLRKQKETKLNCYGATLSANTINGDAFYISPDKKVFILADGASGAGENGKALMSNTCIETAKNFDYASSGLDAKSYVDMLFNQINSRLIEISRQQKNLTYGTIIIAVYDKGILTVTTLGDSPAYLFQDNEIMLVAKNKKRYEGMIDKGYITREQYDGYINGMHDMMKSCFDLYLPQIVPNNIIEQYEIKKGNVFVMCSDGLSDWIKPEIMLKMIKENGAQNGIDNLIAKAKETALKSVNYIDDITAIALLWE